MNTEQRFDTGKYGLKDIYEASLKAAVPLDILNERYEVGDTVLYFDSIQEIVFQENKSSIDARGGFDNRSLVHWQPTREINCILNMGTVSHLAFGVMNATTIKNTVSKKINQHEQIYIDEKGIGQVKHIICPDQKIIIYEIKNGRRVRKIFDFSITDSTILLKEKNIDVLVDYYFDYIADIETVNIGQKDLNGYLSFTGKFRYTDEYTGIQKTGLIEIPRLRIDSNFTVNLGRNISPLVSALQFQAIPTGYRQEAKTIIISYLEEDIDGDF